MHRTASHPRPLSPVLNMYPGRAPWKRMAAEKRPPPPPRACCADDEDGPAPLPPTSSVPSALPTTSLSIHAARLESIAECTAPGPGRGGIGSRRAARLGSEQGCGGMGAWGGRAARASRRATALTALEKGARRELSRAVWIRRGVRTSPSRTLPSHDHALWNRAPWPRTAARVPSCRSARGVGERAQHCPARTLAARAFVCGPPRRARVRRTPTRSAAHRPSRPPSRRRSSRPLPGQISAGTDRRAALLMGAAMGGGDPAPASSPSGDPAPARSPGGEATTPPADVAVAAGRPGMQPPHGLAGVQPMPPRPFEAPAANVQTTQGAVPGAVGTRTAPHAPGGAVIVAPQIEMQPWARRAWGFVADNTNGVIRVDVRRPM
eukprot:354954-Chlamydomonas_euryale.AAC.1